MNVNNKGTGCQKYRITWKNRFEHFQTTFTDFIEQQVLCDVTLVGDGDIFKAHQFVLSACSSYFKNIFKDVPSSQHPIIFLRDVSSQEIKCLLDYMYKGQTVVPNDLLRGFLKTCESLYIQGLCEDPASQSTEEAERSSSQRRMSTTEISKAKEIIHSSRVTNLAPQKCDRNVGSKKRKNNNDDEFDHSKQSKRIADKESVPNKRLLQPHSLALSQNIFRSTDEQVDTCRSQESLCISDLTQVDLPTNGTGENSSNNNINIIEHNVLNSPPHSQQSIIFSVRNSGDSNIKNKLDNTTLESVIFLAEENGDILEISDDNSPCEQPSSSRTMTRKNDGNITCHESDDSTDRFQLVLSPDILDNPDDETDESEIIVRSRPINRFQTKSLRSDNNCNAVCEVPRTENIKKATKEVTRPPDDSRNAIRQVPQLKIVLQKLPEDTVWLAATSNENENHNNKTNTEGHMEANESYSSSYASALNICNEPKDVNTSKAECTDALILTNETEGIDHPDLELGASPNKDLQLDKEETCSVNESHVSTCGVGDSGESVTNDSTSLFCKICCRLVRAALWDKHMLRHDPKPASN